MAAMNFPDSPTIGQEFTVGSKTWVWTGTVWDAVAGTVVGGGGSTDLGTFYGFKFDPTTGKLTMESIDDGSVVRLPAPYGRTPTIKRPDDYREWSFSSRPMTFSWDTVRKTNLLVEVN